MMRGEIVANPRLILLHGGPGFAGMQLLRHFNAPLEKSFAVVYWEQRGTGKSFDRKIPASSMTLEQFSADLSELVNAVCNRLGKDKVALYGQAWGSALGVLDAARFPGKVAAYVGTGQIGDWPASELSSCAFVLAEAERRNNRKALKALRAIGTPPHTHRKMQVQRKWLTRFVGIARGISLWKFFRVSLGGPEAPIFDLPNIVRGLIFCGCMWAEVSALNLVKAVPALQMPVFFILGRHGHVVAAETSVAYFDLLTTPSKRLVWFEKSAHEPPVEEPRTFNAAMVELVRPAVQSSSS